MEISRQSMHFFPTSVVSFFKLEPRLPFTINRFENYAVIVKQEPIKLVQLIFAHPVYSNKPRRPNL